MLTLKRSKKLTFDHTTDTYALGIVIDGGEHIAKSFEEISALSHRVLNQLIKDYFRFKYCQKHKSEPFIKLIENSRTANDMLYDMDANLNKDVALFIEGLIPEHSIITFEAGQFFQEYLYLGHQVNTLRFKQRFYSNDFDPTIVVEVTALIKDLVPLESADNGFLANYLNERCKREPEMAEAYLRELENL